MNDDEVFMKIADHLAEKYPDKSIDELVELFICGVIGVIIQGTIYEVIKEEFEKAFNNQQSENLK